MPLSIILGLALAQSTPSSPSVTECAANCTYEQFDALTGPLFEDALALSKAETHKFGNAAYPEAAQKLIEELFTKSFKALSLCQDLALQKFATSPEPAETVVDATLGTCPKIRTASQGLFHFWIRSQAPASMVAEVRSRVEFPSELPETRRILLAKVLKYRELTRKTSRSR